MASPLATVGVLSIGEMGLGIAKLLIAHNYKVVTNVSDRSPHTHQRARSASIDLLASDQELAQQSDYILSIVPPRDALATATRIAQAVQKTPEAAPAVERSTPLYYIDLNAISPRSATEIANLFTTTSPEIRFIDGGIIGGAPKLSKLPSPSSSNPNDPPSSSWSKPSLVVSGPHPLHIPNPHLSHTLNITHLSPTIGPASGLKMCFAATTKGLTAIAIQAFTTAHSLGVLPELQKHLQTYSPKTGELVERGLVAMPPKAYRWVREMEEIAETMEAEGGFGGEGKGKELFNAVAEVYRLVAEDTELGMEKSEKRERGRTGEDVARCMMEGMGKRKVKME